MMVQARSKIDSIKKLAARTLSSNGNGTIRRGVWKDFCEEAMSGIDNNEEWLSELHESVLHPDEKGANERVTMLVQRLKQGQEAYTYMSRLCGPDLSDAVLASELAREEKQFSKALLSTLDRDWQEDIKVAGKASGQPLTLLYIHKLAAAYESKARTSRNKKRKAARKSSKLSSEEEEEEKEGVLAAVTKMHRGLVESVSEAVTNSVKSFLAVGSNQGGFQPNQGVPIMGVIQNDPKSLANAVQPRFGSNQGHAGGSCYTCGDPNHWSNNCPIKNGNRQAPGMDRRTCYSCGQTGHVQSNCTQQAQGGRGYSNFRGRGGGRGRGRGRGRGFGQQCFNCNMVGHRSFECPHQQCYTCNQTGHRSNQCPSRNNNGFQGWSGSNRVPLGQRMDQVHADRAHLIQRPQQQAGRPFVQPQQFQQPQAPVQQGQQNVNQGNPAGLGFPPGMGRS